MSEEKGTKKKAKRRKAAKATGAASKKITRPARPKPPTAEDLEMTEEDRLRYEKRYEEFIKDGLPIAELKRMPIPALHTIAEKEGLENSTGMIKQDIIFAFCSCLFTL